MRGRMGVAVCSIVNGIGKEGAVTEVKLQPLFHTQNQGIAFGPLVCRFAPDDAAATPHPDIRDGG